MYYRAKGGGRIQPTGGWIRRDSAQRACPLIAGTIRLQGKPDKQMNVRRNRDLSRAGARYFLLSCRLTTLSHAMTHLGSTALARFKKDFAKRLAFRRDFGNSRHARVGKASPQEPQRSGRAAGGGTDYARIMACDLNKGSALTKASSQSVNLLISSDCATRSCEVS
jgi:hypothetical protein